MRKAINENPVVQIALLAVLALAAGMLLLTRMGGGGSEDSAPPVDPAATPAPTATAPAPVSTVPAPSTSVPAAPGTTVPPSTTPGTSAPADPTGFVAGPGLPKPVVDAYNAGDTVVLMIYRLKGIDDPFVFQAKQLVEALPPSSGIEASVFLVQAQNIARYSRITEGVNVDRVPAIVVIKPKDLTDVPTASVSYGVRGPASVVQIVKDAIYAGRELPYYPTK